VCEKPNFKPKVAAATRLISNSPYRYERRVALSERVYRELSTDEQQFVSRDERNE